MNEEFACNFIEDVQDVLNRISYKDIKFIIEQNKQQFQLSFVTYETCNYTQGKIRLEVAYTQSFKLPITSIQVIRLAMNIILWWEQHEALERFTYNGQMLFNPHESRQKIAQLAIPELNAHIPPFSVEAQQ